MPTQDTLPTPRPTPTLTLVANLPRVEIVEVAEELEVVEEDRGEGTEEEETMDDRSTFLGWDLLRRRTRARTSLEDERPPLRVLVDSVVDEEGELRVGEEEECPRRSRRRVSQGCILRGSRSRSRRTRRLLWRWVLEELPRERRSFSIDETIWLSSLASARTVSKSSEIALSASGPEKSEVYCLEGSTSSEV